MSSSVRMDTQCSACFVFFSFLMKAAQSLAEGCVGRCSFSTAPVFRMMRFSLIEESGMKSAPFSSLTPFSEDGLCLDFAFCALETNCWLQINQCTVKKGGIMTLVLPHSTSQAPLCSWAHSVVKLDQLVSRDAPCCCVKA